jgi:DNA-directed RNA polymerase subunit beta'
LTFYSAEEVNIALNEGRLELNARVKLEQKILMKLESWFIKLFKLLLVVLSLMSSVEAAGYINDVLTKKNLRDIMVTY